MILPIGAGVTLAEVAVTVLVHEVEDSLLGIRVDVGIRFITVVGWSKPVAILVLALAGTTGVEFGLNFTRIEGTVKDLNFVDLAFEKAINKCTPIPCFNNDLSRIRRLQVSVNILWLAVLIQPDETPVPLCSTPSM